jgi:hypothetical protein
MWSPVKDGHSYSAMATEDQPSQQGLSRARSPQCILTRAVLGNSTLVYFVMGPADIRWQAILQESVPILFRNYDSASSSVTRHFAPRISPTAPVAISACVDGIMQHVQDRWAAAFAPLQLALLRTVPQPEAEANCMAS